MEKLNVINDATQAAKYEEFLATISRRYIENCNEVLIEEILAHAQKRRETLNQYWTKLRSKYNEQDSLIGKRFQFSQNVHVFNCIKKWFGSEFFHSL